MIKKLINLGYNPINDINSFLQNKINIVKGTDEEILALIPENKNHGKIINDPASEKRAKNRLKIITDLVGDKKFSKYIDIGCGPGDLTKYIAFGILNNPIRENIHGVDIFNPNKFVDYKKITYTKTSGDKIDLPDNHFDLVTAHQSCHHFEKLDKMLYEISRIIKPKGLFILREHDKPDGHAGEVFVAYLDVIHLLWNHYNREMPYKKYIENSYAEYKSKREWIKTLEKYGFKFLRDMYIGGPQKIFYALFISIK